MKMGAEWPKRWRLYYSIWDSSTNPGLGAALCLIHSAWGELTALTLYP